MMNFCMQSKNKPMGQTSGGEQKCEPHISVKKPGVQDDAVRLDYIKPKWT